MGFPRLPANASVKLVRHRDRYRGIDLDLLERNGWIETYQSYQGTPVFNCDYVAAFIGTDGLRARLFGVFRVASAAMPTPQGRLPPNFPHSAFNQPGNYYYDLKRMPEFDDLEGLIIDWGKGARAWHQWLVTPDLVPRIRDKSVVLHTKRK